VSAIIGEEILNRNIRTEGPSCSSPSLPLPVPGVVRLPICGIRGLTTEGARWSRLGLTRRAAQYWRFNLPGRTGRSHLGWPKPSGIFSTVTPSLGFWHPAPPPRAAEVMQWQQGEDGAWRRLTLAETLSRGTRGLIGSMRRSSRC
jgi:hypothetical protein